MQSHSAATRLAATSLLALLPACGGGADREPGAGPSLVLVTLDTTRADALGSYGGPPTPHFDRLAREGVRFAEARTVAPITLPSHASILTGRFPFEHGVRDNGSFRLPDGATTLAERLDEAGYSSAAVVASVVLHSQYGLAQGFGTWVEPPTALEVEAYERTRPAADVVDDALRLAREGHLAPPFFLWVHFFDAHYPYHGAGSGSEHGATPPSGTDREAYARAVATMDREVGRLLAELERRAGRSGLLTAVVADHGEGLGDHGERTHGFQLYDSTLRVPMIVHGPGVAPAVVRDPVSVVDLAPTLLALTGVAPGGGGGSVGIGGVDLLSSGAPRSPVAFEACHPYHSYGWSPLFGLVRGADKWIDGPTPELYDVVADPREDDERSAAVPAVARSMRAALRELGARHGPSERIALDASHAEELRSLGYAGSAPHADALPPLPPGTPVPVLPDGLERLDPKHGLHLYDTCQEALALAGRGRPGDLRRAVELVDDLLAHDPANPSFLAHASSVLLTAGEYERAARAARASLDLLDTPSARTNLASSLYHTGRGGEALALLEETVLVHPFHLLTRLQLAGALADAQRAPEALEHLRFFLGRHRRDDGPRARALELERRLSGAGRP